MLTRARQQQDERRNLKRKRSEEITEDVSEHVNKRFKHSLFLYPWRNVAYVQDYRNGKSCDVSIPGVKRVSVVTDSQHDRMFIYGYKFDPRNRHYLYVIDLNVVCRSSPEWNMQSLIAVIPDKGHDVTLKLHPTRPWLIEWVKNSHVKVRSSLPPFSLLFSNVLNSVEGFSDFELIGVTSDDSLWFSNHNNVNASIDETTEDFEYTIKQIRIDSSSNVPRDCKEYTVKHDFPIVRNCCFVTEWDKQPIIGTAVSKRLAYRELLFYQLDPQNNAFKLRHRFQIGTSDWNIIFYFEFPYVTTVVDRSYTPPTTTSPDQPQMRMITLEHKNNHWNRIISFDIRNHCRDAWMSLDSYLHGQQTDSNIPSDIPLSRFVHHRLFDVHLMKLIADFAFGWG